MLSLWSPWHLQEDKRSCRWKEERSLRQRSIQVGLGTGKVLSLHHNHLLTYQLWFRKGEMSGKCMFHILGSPHQTSCNSRDQLPYINPCWSQLPKHINVLVKKGEKWAQVYRPSHSYFPSLTAHVNTITESASRGYKASCSWPASNTNGLNTGPGNTLKTQPTTPRTLSHVIHTLHRPCCLVSLVFHHIGIYSCILLGFCCISLEDFESVKLH